MLFASETAYDERYAMLTYVSSQHTETQVYDELTDVRQLFLLQPSDECKLS